jgi:hypothetical protein
MFEFIVGDVEMEREREFDLLKINAVKKPQVLLYNFREEERLRKIKRYLIKTGVSLKVVQASEFMESLGYLLGMPLYQKNPGFSMGKNFSEEMLVMDGFSSERMDRFFEFFREEGLEPVELKAVVTKYNAGWNSIRLHEELAGERKAVK